MDLDSLVASMRADQYGEEDEEAATETTPTPANQSAAPVLPTGSAFWNPKSDPSIAVPPQCESATPATEVLRLKSIRSLQSRFKKLAAELLGKQWNPSFERWLFTQAGHSSAGLDLLPAAGSTSQRNLGLESEIVAAGGTEALSLQIAAEMASAASSAGRKLARLASITPAIRRVKRCVDRTKGRVTLKAGGVAMEINHEHEHKLKALFQLHNRDQTGSEQSVLQAIFCVLVRYSALQGGGFQGGGFQAAINEEVFDVLHRHLGVQMECFASPLNSYYPNFCSAFLDSDRCFGSLGSFFDFRPTSGAYEANPPFVPEVVQQMAKHMEQLLRLTQLKLCFVVIIPRWPHTRGWQQLEQSHFMQRHLVIPQQEHGYTEGLQHARDTRSVFQPLLVAQSKHQEYRIASFDTSVFFMMNPAAVEAWPVAEGLLEQLQLAFRSRHETNAEKRAVPARSLYLGDVDSETNEDELRALCGQFGSLESLAIQDARGCAFVNFEQQAAASAALEAFQGKRSDELAECAGEHCYVKYGKSRVHEDPCERRERAADVVPVNENTGDASAVQSPTPERQKKHRREPGVPKGIESGPAETKKRKVDRTQGLKKNKSKKHKIKQNFS